MQGNMLCQDPRSYCRSVSNSSPRVGTWISSSGRDRTEAAENDQKSITAKDEELTREYDGGKTSPSCSVKGP
jgi:hypothetical protein